MEDDLHNNLLTTQMEDDLNQTKIGDEDTI